MVTGDYLLVGREVTNQFFVLTNQLWFSYWSLFLVHTFPGLIGKAKAIIKSWDRRCMEREAIGMSENKRSRREYKDGTLIVYVE